MLPSLYENPTDSQGAINVGYQQTVRAYNLQWEAVTQGVTHNIHIYISNRVIITQEPSMIPLILAYCYISPKNTSVLRMDDDI